MYRVDLTVRPKPGVKDPQSEAVSEALRGMGYGGFKVNGVGRALRLEIEATSGAQARATVEEMCKRMLVNPNIEAYEIDIEEL